MADRRDSSNDSDNGIHVTSPDVSDTSNEVLDDAHEAVYERDADDSFETIALLWSEYFETDVSASDVAYAMILLKIGRRMNGNDSSDIPTDIAGYAENAARYE